MNFIQRHPYELLACLYVAVAAIGFGSGHWAVGCTNGATAVLMMVIAYRRIR